MKCLSTKAASIKPSGIRKFFDLANTMEGVISLGVGEPDFQTPWSIRESAIHSLEIGRTKYTSNAGLLPLRTEITNFVKRKYDLHYDPEDVLVTVGGSEAIDLAIRMLVEEGDEVIIPEPCYVSYEPITTLTGGVPVHIQCTEENEFRVTPEQIKEVLTEKTKMLILSYPNNPTGAVLRHEDLVGIAEVLKDTDVIVLSDEIYAELCYGDEEYESIAHIEGMYVDVCAAVSLNKPLIETMTKIHQSCIMCSPTTSQYAGITALTSCDEEILKMKEEYDFRRKYCVRKLNEMGLHTFEPRGAFYVFPNITSSGMDSDTFCMELLKRKNVAIVPGTAFGESGEGFARISYAYSLSHLQTALGRIEDFLHEIKEEK